MKNKKKQKPEQIRFGNIKAVIWENTNPDGKTYYNLNFVRIYKDKNGKWQETGSFPVDACPKLALCAQETYKWFFAKNQKD